MSKPRDFMNNFAMLIPQDGIKTNEMVEDSRGAPIYAGCPSKGQPCACTGACQRVIDYTKDPVKLESHREHIRNYNERQRNGMQNFLGERRWNGNTQIWELKDKANEG